MKRALLTSLALCACAGAAQAQGQPAAAAEAPFDAERALERANRAYTFGDYQTAVNELTPAVEPKMRLVGIGEQARAFELLGLSHWYLGQTSLAQRYFRRMILLNPDKALDPRLVPPPIIEFYDGLRADLADDIKRSEAELRKRIEEEERQRQERNALIREVTIEKRERLVALLPFGAGQFQNGDHKLGWFFMISEGAAAMTSLACFLAIESLRQDNTRFRQDETDLAQNLQTVQLTSAYLAIGLGLVGIIEAQVSFTEQVETDRGFLRPGGPDGSPAGATFIWRW
ncbi:MAG: hypothetical protein ACE366_06110 [Bradymonadia bacterium]